MLPETAQSLKRSQIHSFNEPGSLHGRKRGRMYSGINIRTKQIYLKRRQCEEEF